MSKLPYLVAEINTALEVYLFGRTGQQYNRTAFILCDDGTELACKLFLITDTSKWSDTKANGQFKRYKEVTGEVRAVFLAKRAADHGAVDALLNRMEGRRDRRNEFFHSTRLLDLNFHARDCIEALVDLLDFGKVLFGPAWDAAVAAVGTMETHEAVLRVDKKTYSDPSVGPKMNALLARQPRLGLSAKAKGCEVVHHPEDIHLRLAIRNGGKSFRDAVRGLL
jgi:hypothetical protein